MRTPSSLVIASILGLSAHGCSHAVGAGNGPDPAPGTTVEDCPAGADAPAAVAPAAVPVYHVPVDGLPAIGRSDALVTVVEFTDYECPFSQRAEHTVVRLRATYGDALRVVVVEHPLPFHEQARPAALAALAAEDQGRFEGMHERLFALGKGLDGAAIEAAAADAGVDVTRQPEDANLARAQRLADRLGVQGTPTFFIDGRLVKGAQPFEAFRDVVDERLAAARSLVAQGTAPRDVYAAMIAGGREHVDAETEADTDAVDVVPTEGAPSRGPEAAPITIVAFSDFECPFCARATSTVRAVEVAHPGEVRLIFKNRPLPMHPHAREAAIAALAAGRQGRFWDFHDRVFAGGGVKLDEPGLLAVAADLGLNTTRFERDCRDPALAAQVARDDADADALKVTGTPTFFVNGRRVVGAQPATAFEAAIARSR